MLTTETYSSGRAMAYSYDDGARLSSVGDGTTTFANTFTYAPQGGLSSETFGNGAVHSLTYNNALQASQIKLKQSATGAELQRFDYSYGQVNQADGSVDTTKNNGQIGRIDGAISAVKQWDQRFVYDPLSRLSTAAEYRGDNGAQTYQAHYDYDRYGNRFQYQSNSNVAYTPVVSSDINGANNRFISSGATPTSYDPAGNIISDAKFRSLNYVYDANNRQTSASSAGVNQTSVYDCAGQRVQTTASGTTRTMVYDIFGQEVADYTGSSGSTLERENIYRGGQLLATSETLGAAAPSGLAAAPSSTNILLSWSAAAGATNYRVERKGAGGSYGLLGTTASTSMSDSGVSSGSAYLYKVCAADGAGNCTSSYSNVVLGAPLNFTTDPTIRTISDDSTGATVTTMKAAHITQLRTAVNAVRSLAGLSNAGWTHPAATGDIIYADDVRDLRTALDQALTALGIQTSSYSETLAGVPNGTTIKGVHITELRQRATSGSGTAGSGGGSGGLKYVLTDLQGSARAVMNNSGVGTSAIIARHDYLPFGEEVLSGTGLRTGTQGYGAGDSNRKKYALTERDDATGLDHTWWRKYENRSGRWTSPDPLGGNIGDPQSLNRYVYVQNDPVNFVDPSGLILGDGFCSAQYSFSECGGWRGFYGGYFGDDFAEFRREYGGMSAAAAEALMLHNQRVTNALGGYGFLTSEEVLHNLDFQISYGYNADGSLWTDFNIGVNIGGSSNPFNFLGSGTLDQWPPASPGGRGPFGWPEPSGRPTVRLPPGIRTTPNTGTPGIKVDPNYVNQPRVNPSNPQLTNLSIWQKIGFVISAGARAVANMGGRITIILVSPQAFNAQMCRAHPNDPACGGSGGGLQ